MSETQYSDNKLVIIILKHLIRYNMYVFILENQC